MKVSRGCHEGDLESRGALPPVLAPRRIRFQIDRSPTEALCPLGVAHFHIVGRLSDSLARVVNHRITLILVSY